MNVKFYLWVLLYYEPFAKIALNRVVPGSAKLIRLIIAVCPFAKF